MARFLITGLLIGHGLVHGILFGVQYIPDARSDMPFDPSRSWLLGQARTVGFVTALVVTAAFLVAGAGYLGRAAWWPQAALIASGLSLLLLTIFANRWLVAGYVLSIAVAAGAWQAPAV